MATTVPTTTIRTTKTTKTEPERLVGFALGANLGDPRGMISVALDRLAGHLGALKIAPFYRTEPVSKIAQPDFLNTVALTRSRATPEELLTLALEVERQLGRLRSVRDGPRTIDIDLLFVGQLERHDAGLVLPHPRLRDRRFVLAPLADVAPGLPLPPDGATPRDLLARLPPGPRTQRLT